MSVFFCLSVSLPIYRMKAAETKKNIMNCYVKLYAKDKCLHKISF